jgi:hypothetical protein
MVSKKELLKKVRELSDLDISLKDRRNIIETSYCFLRDIRGFPEVLGNSILEAKAKHLTGNDAYAFIEQNFNEYREDLKNKINLQSFDENYNYF